MTTVHVLWPVEPPHANGLLGIINSRILHSTWELDVSTLANTRKKAVNLYCLCCIGRRNKWSDALVIYMEYTLVLGLLVAIELSTITQHG